MYSCTKIFIFWKKILYDKWKVIINSTRKKCNDINRLNALKMKLNNDQKSIYNNIGII